MRKIRLHAAAGFAGCDGSEVVEVEDDMTDAELDEMAGEFMYQYIAPEAWWEEAEEDAEVG